MHTMDTMGYGHKKYRPPLSPTSFYQPDYYSRHTTLRPQSEYRFAGGGYPLARETSTRSSGLCSAALVGGALFAAVTVLVVAALAFYMGALRPDNGEPMILFEGTLRVTRGDVYGGAPGSPAWRERARRYGASLRQVFSAPSPLRQAFAGAIVTGFGDRRLDVHFRLYLDRRKIPSSVANIEEALKNILIQNINSKHSSFGQIKIDTSSIVIKRDLEHTYHSESYVKEALNESIATTNQKQLTPQNGNDKTLQTRVGVVRKTTVKPNHPSKKHDPDEPDIDTENIPVVQGTFQITKTEADITENKQNSSPIRHDEKIHKTGLKTTTSTKAPISRSTVKATTMSRSFSSTIKSRPFTTTSSFNAKAKTEPTTKKEIEKTTKKSFTTVISSTTSNPTTTTVQSTTNNVSQILLDLLTNKNHYKDLPKIDTLFTVPHIIDNEPWRPITQPYYEPVNEPTPTPEIAGSINAEDRMGVAEVVEDISLLETLLSPDPPTSQKEKSTLRPISLYRVDSNLEADVYVPSPIYTSFTLPTFAPPIKGMETLGSSYPKPHPIPVDKISSVVEFNDNAKYDDQDDGKPVERPPKEKTTSVSLNVLNWDQQDLNDTKKINIGEGSILKKQNISIASSTTVRIADNENTVYTPSPASSTTGTYTISLNTSTDNLDFEPTTSIITSTIKTNIKHQNDSRKEHSTKRPNDKVSIIPSTSAPYHTWELVNTSTSDNDTFSKTSPEKYYNETLQAIITRNDALFPNTTPKFTSKVSILRNFTDIIRKFSESESQNSEKKYVPIKTDIVEDPPKMTGSVEVVPDEEIEVTTAGIITLLPAKSNLGVNRPLRPRPKIKADTQVGTENMRGFFSNSERQEFFDEVTTENYVQKSTNQRDQDGNSDVVTSLDSAPQKHNTFSTDSMAESVRVMEIVEAPPSGNRLPKSSELLNFPNNKNANIPEGTFRVSYHVTGSVSSKQANKTQTLPAYRLTLEPDVVLEIPINQSNTLTIDKLKKLASLATISDSNNNTLFPASGAVISTKAIPSSYTLNQAGIKILTKTFNKIQSSNQEQNSLETLEKTRSKPIKTHIVKDTSNIKDHAMEEHCDNTTSFQCLNGNCLPLTLRCNRLIDCPDGEDENTCSCADYLRAEFSTSKICDGIVDCWDYSDENNCDWCKKDQYICANARQCVEKAQICDGTPDCPLGDDEKSCVTLADNLKENEVIPYNEEGFVMVRKRGVWGRLCVESFKDVVEEAHSSLQLPDLGRAVCRAMTFNDAGSAREAREGRRTNSYGYWEVWHNTAARAADTRLTFRRASCKRHRALRVKCTGLDCGIRPHADLQQPRVVGGEAAAAGAWPWQAALYREGDFQCGATLIHPQWLVSASHCFYQALEAYWVARLGALRRDTWPYAPWEHIAPVRQIVPHPRYAARGFRNDIALLRIDPAPLHARTRPACLPAPRTLPPAGTHCTVLGWGQLYEHERIFPDTLQEVELPVISTPECKRLTRLLRLYRITEDMFCAGYERGGRDACLGDSGGPLMCQESGRWYVYGITSNGYGCARANRPGVYTKVSNYIEWIDTIIANNTPTRNDTNEYESNEYFYSDLETAENKRTPRINTCKGYRCPLGKCLPSSSVCNGFLECSDGSDERGCIKPAPNSSSIDPD